MAYDRQAVARERLAAIGVDPGSRAPYGVLRGLSPALRAESIERVARQRASAGREYHGGGANVAAPRTRASVARALGRRPRSTPRAKTTRVTTSAGEVVATTSQAVITREMRKAAADGKRVALLATVDGRTRWIDGRGSQADVIGGGPTGAGAAEAQGHRGEVQMYVGGPDVAKGGGLDPADLLDWYDEYGDWWDVFEGFFDEVVS